LALPQSLSIRIVSIWSEPQQILHPTQWAKTPYSQALSRRLVTAELADTFPFTYPRFGGDDVPCAAQVVLSLITQMLRKTLSRKDVVGELKGIPNPKTPRRMPQLYVSVRIIQDWRPK
jgi:hypothetical protein